MGYQESWFHITPQSKFNEMVRIAARMEKEGRYARLDTYPTDVVTLKEPLGGVPAGDKVLWVCGERCFQTVDAILERAPPAGLFQRCEVRVIPIEEVLTGDEDPRIAGIVLNDPRPSENASMRRQSFEQYAQRLQERAVCR